MIDIDVLLVNLDTRTVYCSDDVMRPIYELYDSDAELTDDAYEAVVAVVKVDDHKYIILDLLAGETAVN